MIILWDLHDVVFHKTHYAWLRKLYSCPEKRKIIKNLSFSLNKMLTTFMLNKLKLSKKEVTSEELIQCAYESKNPALARLVHDFSHVYKPDTEVTYIIKQLSEQQYTQHVCSNIGPTLFALLQKKFPTIMDCFSYAKIVAYHKEDTVKKPDPVFFMSYLKESGIQPNTIIFIDDKQKNVDSAKQCGMKGIHFKNGLLLRQELEQYDIVL